MPSASARPLGVPADYVFTRHGWFHPSCVISVGSDEAVGPDLVIRGRDGAAHAVFAPCAEVRYDRRGRKLAAPGDGQRPGAQAVAESPPASVTYDGYIVYFGSNGAIAPGSTLTTEWIVPPPPNNVDNQDIALFNAILTSADGGDILQSVLDFNGVVQGKWSIESEHCCLMGNDMPSAPIVVAPGDLIRGFISGAGCTATGVCQSWTVTTTDVTTGKSTTLNTVAPNGVPNGVSPASLETYGITSCDMFPAGGATTFMNNRLIDANSDVQAREYDVLILAGVAAEVPTDCGYAGKASGNDYTVIYGDATVTRDGGTADGSATSDASIDFPGRSGDAEGTGRDGAMDAAGIQGDNGDPPLADAATGDSSEEAAGAGTNGGCSCSTASASDARPAAMMTIGCVLAGAVRRRTRRRRAQSRVVVRGERPAEFEPRRDARKTT